MAISWTPSREQSFAHGGADVTFWAAPTRHVRRHLHAAVVQAGMDDDVLTRRGWRQRLGPLLLVNQVSWAYGTRQRFAKDLRGFARAAQVTFAAVTKVEQVRSEPVRPSRLRLIRAERARADTEAYRLRLAGTGG